MLQLDPPIILEGTWVRLEPLGFEHVDDLLVAASDDTIWRYMTIPKPDSKELIVQWIQNSHVLAESGTIIPFAIRYLPTGHAIGGTRYMEIARSDNMLEIGFSWLSSRYWRTPVNTECKYLLMRYAFEQAGAMRVQLKTDLRNERSQRAIERIGGVREGVLRKHRVLPDGYKRSSVMYSIIDDEWPSVKARLDAKLAEPAEPVTSPTQ